MLTDGSGALTDEAYDLMEADTRTALVSLFVRPECELVFSKAAAENNYAAEDRFLYLGSHQCCERAVDEPDSVYVELWAWIDEDSGSDFVTWNISTVDEGSQHPIYYCPFCGVDLRAETLIDEADDLFHGPTTKVPDP
jgi:hypothetical protein